MRIRLSQVIALAFLGLLMGGGVVLLLRSDSPVSRYPWKGSLEERDALAVRMAPPAGYERVKVNTRTFAHWLRYLPLKPAGTQALCFDGRPAPNPFATSAVVDIDLGAEDLQRGPQAIMRLWAEYLYAQSRAGAIGFTTQDGDTSFAQWASAMKRNRTHEALLEYLTAIYPKTNAATLLRDLTPVGDLTQMRVGDVLVHAGPREAAAIVVDMAVEPGANRRVFLLAHADAPAQDIHVVNNALDAGLAPWFPLELKDGKLLTPEGVFEPGDLKRF